LKVIQEISDKLEYQTSSSAKDNNPEQASSTGKSSKKSNGSNKADPLQSQLNKIGKKFKIINEFLGWPRQLDPCLLTELKRFRKYDPNQFTDLLRFIRNKKNHYRELPDDVKNLLGDTNESFITYFLLKFPRLMIAVDEFVRSKLIEDPVFSQYYINDF